MVKLGVTDFGLAESTPALFKGRLVRFDSVHVEYGRPVGCISADGRCRDPAMVDSTGHPQPTGNGNQRLRLSELSTDEGDEEDLDDNEDGEVDRIVLALGAYSSGNGDSPSPHIHK